MRSNQRGMATVEMLLSVPVLLLFMVLSLDFARSFKTRQGLEVAARHQAWAKARSRNGFEPGQPRPPSEGTAHRVHRVGVGEPLSIDYWPFHPLIRMDGEHDKNFNIVATTYRPPTFDRVKHQATVLADVRDSIQTLNFGTKWESEVWDLVAGKITVEGADVTQPIRRLRILAAGELLSRHYVQLWTHTSQGNGWWDVWKPLRARLFPELW